MSTHPGGSTEQTSTPGLSRRSTRLAISSSEIVQPFWGRHACTCGEKGDVFTSCSSRIASDSASTSPTFPIMRT